MEYRCYIGYWEGELSLSPHPDDEHIFIELGPLAMTVVDRTVVIAPDPTGHVATAMPRDHNAGLGLKYIWRLGSQPWARFMRHEVRADMDEDAHVLSWEVSADHVLAWPKIENRGGTIDAAAVAQRELYLRGKSAFEEAGEDGLRRVLRNVPGRIRRLLAGRTWGYTIKLIQEGEELPCT